MTEDGRRAADRAGEQDADAGPRVDRRRLLRTGVNVGLSGALVWGFGADYAASSGTETITYALARPEPDAEALEPRTREVPVEWAESLRVASEFQERVLSAGMSPLVGAFVVPGSHAEPEASVSIDATDERVRESVEELSDGVPVDLNVLDVLPPRPGSDSRLPEAHQVSDLADAVPGGVVCLSEQSFGTLSPALIDAERGSRFFATSNHVFGAAGTKETEHRGAPLSVRHEGERVRVGEVDRGFPLADVVRVDPVGGYRPASTIERAEPSRVVGQYTKLGLADLMARGEPLTKMGALSDRTTGGILGVDGYTCYSGEVCKPGQFKWGDDRSIVDGDSGSVTYHADPEHPDEYVLVAGINNARSWWSEADFSWGTAAHHLLDAHGLHF